MEGACYTLKKVIETRLMHIKKSWLSLLFWLFIPIIGSIGITSIVDLVQEDSKIPVGVVITSENETTHELYNEISETSFIRAYNLSEEVALYKLKKHELDSVFILNKDFAEEINQGNRNNIITSYHTNQSIAYAPVKEMILSYVQQETGRSETAFIIQKLAEDLNSDANWTKEEIIAKSKEIQQNENLLQTSFSFSKQTSDTTQEVKYWNIWGIWSILSMLATLLIFDWVVKENHSSVVSRFAFMEISYKGYLVRNLIFYSFLLLLIDCLTSWIFHLFYDRQLNLTFIFGLLSYRGILLLGAFLLAQIFRKTFRYYVVSYGVTLIALIGSGALLPVNGILSRWPWFSAINPVSPLLSDGILNFWSVFLVVAFVIWFVRKERHYA